MRIYRCETDLSLAKLIADFRRDQLLASGQVSCLNVVAPVDPEFELVGAGWIPGEGERYSGVNPNRIPG
jgi:hypothetical protein